MAITSLSINTQTASVKYAGTKSQSVSVSKDGAVEIKSTDSFVKSAEYSSQSITYSRNAASEGSSDKVETGKTEKGLSAKALQALQDQQTASFKAMIEKMFARQGGADKIKGKGLKDILSTLSVTSDEAAAAANAISADGEWGVNSVATNIMNMAVALSGGDSSKLETLRNAVEAGFKAAGRAWGDTLPDVCQQTYKEVMKRFDFWEQNGSLDGYVMDK